MEEEPKVQLKQAVDIDAENVDDAAVVTEVQRAPEGEFSVSVLQQNRVRNLRAAEICCEKVVVSGTGKGDGLYDKFAELVNGKIIYKRYLGI